MQLTRTHMYALASLLLAPLLGACIFVHTEGEGWGHRYRGSGHRAEVRRELPTFRVVEVDAAANLDVTIGSPAQVVLSADDDLLAHVRTDVRGEKLRIWLDCDCDFREGLRVRLTAPRLDALSIDGAATVSVARLRGASLQLAIDGTGSVTARGDVDRLVADLDGAGSFELRDLVVRDARISIDGTGSAAVHATDTLHYEISGVGSVSFVGDPALSGSVSGVGGLHRLSTP